MIQKITVVELGVNPSTVSRKLGRNTGKSVKISGHYLVANARRRTNQRQYFKPKLVKFTPEIKDKAVE